MNREWKLRCLLLVPLLGIGSIALAQTQPIAVEPAELERRGDLVGKVVSVDDRTLYYQPHQGRGYDELMLKRTKVVFRLPPRLRPKDSPGTPPVIVTGRLARNDGQLVCDVIDVQVLPPDLERLDREVTALGTRDFEGRKRWAAWAERRGNELKDRALLQRSRSLLAEAFQIEADQTRGTVDAPAAWLSLAEDARKQRISEPEPSALAHRALRAKLAAASRTGELKTVLASIEKFFPQASNDQASGRVRLERWQKAYETNPAATYRDRQLPGDVRKAFDRQLWADADQKLMEAQAAEDPRAAISLAKRSEAELPERPELAGRFLAMGLESARQNLGVLRRDEVTEMAQTYRDKLHNPKAALELYRSWLQVKRERLSTTDAEGPLGLAALYEELLQDKTAALELLQRAWKIDPNSKEVVEAFRTRGYRLVKDQWVEEGLATPGEAAGEPRPTDTPPARRPGSGRGLRGMTPEEVLQQVRSKPDHKAFSGTKGQLIEQWIFVIPNQRQVRLVNFRRTPADLQPRVVSDYFLPATAIRGELKPAH
jgi:tetratricopeptide (TPR) repeat protein